MNPTQVLVVEDDPNLNADIVFFLQAAGIEAVGVGDGVALDAHLAQHPCDVVVLDLGLPGEDGLSIARRLATHVGLGLVILTARDRLEDRLAGWNSGAHVYLIKPVPLAEIAAVVSAVFRRLHSALITEHRPWQLFSQRRELHTPSGLVIPLTHRESLVLGVLAEAPQQQIPRDLTLAQDTGVSLDSLIHRLRRKLKNHGDPLRTVYGAGYVFEGVLVKIESLKA